MNTHELRIGRSVRRLFLGLALCGITGAGGWAAAPRPNIILILADGLGYEDLGSPGQKTSRTPNLDAMAAQGTVFTDFYPGAAGDAPTRCCIMTGLHTGHARIRSDQDDARKKPASLQMTDVTMAEMLRRGGYATGGMGEWGLGERKDIGTAFKQGFDLWFGTLERGAAKDPYPEKLWRDEREIVIPENADGVRGIRANELFTDEALGFIMTRRRTPFFLYLAYTLPRAVIPESPEEGHAPAGMKAGLGASRASHAAMVARLDAQVGRILRQLRVLGLDESTIVFFSSVPHFAREPAMSRDSNTVGSLRTKSGPLTEEALRAPMIVRWPGHVPSGRKIGLPWAGWDLLPTAAALAGVDALPPVDGVSVVPTLLGSRQKLARPLYWETSSGDELDQAIRIGDLKAVRHGRDGAISVHDLRSDLRETTDIAARHPDFVARARTLFASAHASSSDRSVPKNE